MNTSVDVDVALAAAPEVVRDYIQDGILAKQVVAVGKQYNLHVDVVGKLAELSRNMLLGLSSPAEVVGELVMAGIDAQTAQHLLGSLNEKVFIPIREEIRNPKLKKDESDEEDSNDTVPVAPVPTAPAMPVAAAAVPPPAPISAAPAPVQAPAQPAYTPVSPLSTVSSFAPPPAPAPAPRPVPPPPAGLPTAPAPDIHLPPSHPEPARIVPPIAAPVSPPLAVPIAPPPAPAPMDAPAPVLSTPTAPDHPAMRTMATDMQAAKEHRPTLPPLFGQSAAPAAPPPPMPTPVMPTAAPAPILPMNASRPIPAPPPNLPGAPIVKEYSTDPYREPIE